MFWLSKRFNAYAILMFILFTTDVAYAGGPAGWVIKQVSAGENFSCSLQYSGAVYCWGISDHAELGPQGPFPSSGGLSTTPIPVTGFNATVTAISSGDSFTCALLSNGQVWCWGLGPPNFGRLPQQVGGTWSAPATGISAKGNHACAALSNGSVMCWGDNWNYQLGYDDNALTAKVGTYQGSETIALSVPGVYNAVAVAAGRNHSCAVLQETMYWPWQGSLIPFQYSPVQCWGENSWGQLGVAIPPTGAIIYVHETDELVDGGQNVNFEAFDNFAHQGSNVGDALASMSGGDYTSCVVTSSHGIYCWGGSGTGDAGNVGCDLKCATGSSVTFIGQAPAGVPKAVSTYGMTSCGIYGQDIYCWGDNTNGLTRGLNPYAYSPDPTLIGYSATSVAIGKEHVCAVAYNGEYVFCWGHSPYGQLGPYVSVGSNHAGPISIPIP